jgi:hypothetical protein
MEDVDCDRRGRASRGAGREIDDRARTLDE